MRATLLATLLVLSLAAPRDARAAHPTAWPDSTVGWPSATAAHRPGRWSLDFTLAPDFQLTSFEGGKLSATHATSARGAWRIGLGYSLSTDRSGSGAGLLFGDSTVTAIAGSDRKNDLIQLAAVVLRLHRFHPSRRITGYFSLGPDLSAGLQNSEQVRSFSPITTGVVHTTTHRYAVGIDGEFGAEAIVTRDLGLFAQYGSRAGYAWSRQLLRGQALGSDGTRLGSPAEAVTKDRNWFLNNAGVLLGVSAYL